MGADERRELQNERLQAMVQRIFDGPVPLFRDKLGTAGVDAAGDITTVDDLAGVPLTVKQDLRDSEAAAPPWGSYRFTDPRRAVRLGTSTGTTGQPTITVWTRHDLWIEYESGARNWWRMGYRPGMIVTHAHPAYLYGGGVMLQGTYEYLGLLVAVGTAPRHRRAGRTGRPLLDPGHPGHPVHGLCHRAVPRGGRPSSASPWRTPG